MISVNGNHISITKADTGGIVFQLTKKCNDFNLNGVTVHFIVKQKGQNDDTAIISLAQTISVDISKIAISLTSQNTDHPPIDYDWALKLSKASQALTVAEGIFSIVQGVFA